MWRFLKRAIGCILLLAVFFCGYALGKQRSEVTLDSVCLEQVLDLEEGKQYLKTILENWDKEALEEALEVFAQWVKNLPD